jgi:hypothetical protein
VIPGIGSSPVDEWSIAYHRSLVNDLILDNSQLQVQVFVVEHGLTVEEFNSWDQLLKQAANILGLVEDVRNQTQTASEVTSAGIAFTN